MESVLTHSGNASTQWNPQFTERFQPFRDFSSNSFILNITDVQPNDTGVYYCSVQGWIYGSGSQLIVDSNTGPVLLQSPSLENIIKDHTAQLRCTMRNATVTDTNVHWYRLSRKQIMKPVLIHPRSGSTQQYPEFTKRFQSSRDSSSNSFILTIKSVQPSDAGVYYCSVWGIIYGTGSQLNITNAGVPVLHQSSVLEHVTKGHTARLQCTMRNAIVTHTNVHWDRQQTGNKKEWILTYDMRNITQWSPGFTERFQSSRDPSNNSFILTITNVQPSDAGFYYCKLWEDISGNGTQLTVTEESSPGFPWTSDPILIIGTILGITVLICIVLLTFFLWKQKLHSSAKDSTQGSPGEDQNVVYTTVNVRTQSSGQASVPPVVLAERECHYAEVHFHRQGSSQPTVTAAERSSEYAVIKQARN
ncbi:polymeric immunoglobulin receptor-like [Hemiscyllium ocellatum]|uniref:polymeric immunoglobulin receptor-like n=1 Tax=Hemiscyllium ocellatum TaxID=170820 RepID=UPI00296757CC|nr:polymeric immunoglobulin receptor-like [Hemiscyllium ocellatum]